MMSMKTVAAIAAAAGLMWGSAHAAPETAPQMSEVIILELPPMAPGEAVQGGDQEQALLGMLLLQLLGAMQAEGDMIEVQPPSSAQGQRI
jgi:hypothetical protein